MFNKLFTLFFAIVIIILLICIVDVLLPGLLHAPAIATIKPEQLPTVDPNGIKLFCKVAGLACGGK